MVSSVFFHGMKVDLTFDQKSSHYGLQTSSNGALRKFQFNDLADLDLNGHLSQGSKVYVKRIGSSGGYSLVACLQQGFNSGGTYGTAHVFGFVQGNFKELGKLASRQMFEFPSLDANRQVISRSYEIGNMYHGAEPRWQEFFQVRNSRLVQVTHSKKLFGPWVGYLWKTLQQFPSDEECWHYYGIATQRCGVRIRPRDAYLKMLRQRKHWVLDESRNPREDELWLEKQMRRNRWPAASKPPLNE